MTTPSPQAMQAAKEICQWRDRNPDNIEPKVERYAAIIDRAFNKRIEAAEKMAEAMDECGSHFARKGIMPNINSMGHADRTYAKTMEALRQWKEANG